MLHRCGECTTLGFLLISKGTELAVRLDPTVAIELLTDDDLLLSSMMESCCKITSKNKIKEIG